MIEFTYTEGVAGCAFLLALLSLHWQRRNDTPHLRIHAGPWSAFFLSIKDYRQSNGRYSWAETEVSTIVVVEVLITNTSHWGNTVIRASATWPRDLVKHSPEAEGQWLRHHLPICEKNRVFPNLPELPRMRAPTGELVGGYMTFALPRRYKWRHLFLRIVVEDAWGRRHKSWIRLPRVGNPLQQAAPDD